MNEVVKGTQFKVALAVSNFDASLSDQSVTFTATFYSSKNRQKFVVLSKSQMYASGSSYIAVVDSAQIDYGEVWVDFEITFPDAQAVAQSGTRKEILRSKVDVNIIQ